MTTAIAVCGACWSSGATYEGKAQCFARRKAAQTAHCDLSAAFTYCITEIMKRVFDVTRSND